MNDRKPLLLASSAAVFSLVALCLLGVIGIILLALQRQLPPLPTLEIPTITPTRTVGLMGRRATPTLTPAHPPTHSPASPTFTASSPLTTTLGITSTQPVSGSLGLLTPTLAISGTLEAASPLTNAVIISGTLIQIEATPTHAPALSGWCIPPNTVYQNAQVLKVIDGVTIEVLLDGQTRAVRYLGIDLPAVAPRLDSADLAKAYNSQLVAGKIVQLARDQSDANETGQLLRYVLAGGVFVNRVMVENGYAIANSLPPNVSCALVFQQAEEQARQALRGVWGATPTPTRTPLPPTATVAVSGTIKINLISAEGKSWQDANEFVEIKNTSSFPIQLQGWTLNDADRHTFVFPNFILGPGKFCRIYTNLYQPGTCGFSYFSPSPIWDDVEDCAYLRDALGNLIDTVCYE